MFGFFSGISRAFGPHIHHCWSSSLGLGNNKDSRFPQMMPNCWDSFWDDSWFSKGGILRCDQSCLPVITKRQLGEEGCWNGPTGIAPILKSDDISEEKSKNFLRLLLWKRLENTFYLTVHLSLLYFPRVGEWWCHPYLLRTLLSRLVMSCFLPSYIWRLKHLVKHSITPKSIIFTLANLFLCTTFPRL